ncbi:2-amino-4-hydroxy-6-hydroxymethyldihydropteridine diphosphokinase [Desulfobotulus alkaliphilus]|uniref:2-amino-4-hydroxy-6-hydroxymethyldihydropteridine pyrophosphokinase n=1 Tax=Desulfobotulus alkaliphilus TaxID=622671 RepID=A0A562RZG7_9BACT|nr:2-amino-4-hydroxy-6-hydroxymethyldihydropteridine diphosphokinase [Desulfobotulus alkaliphilus]TWI74293.1 2-amino-4-hydroxy-6-hydroxymethyldihydropteridine diphosphokinase [Desulfobotulus alkaliphilus]
MNAAWISLGANLGDPVTTLQQALESIRISDGIRLEAVSFFYKSAPVDYEDQPVFVNAAARVRTCFEPEKFLECLFHLQKQAGQGKKAFRYGPRLLDLDLLLYENRVCRGKSLEIPHPRMHLRRFVLKPLCDINPHMRHPLLHETMAELLGKLPENSQWVERIPCPELLLP